MKNGKIKITGTCCKCGKSVKENGRPVTESESKLETERSDNYQYGSHECLSCYIGTYSAPNPFIIWMY